MNKFTNQLNFRVDNQLKVISILQNGPQSLNYLADKLNVSFTAISKIVNQLIEFDVLRRVNKKSSNIKRGRIPVLVKLNNHVGLTCAIDFSSTTITVSLNEINGKIVASREINDVVFITQETLEKVSELIKEMLAEDKENRKLLQICIACPGLISKRDGQIVLSFRFKTDQASNPANYFFNEFNTPTMVYNDVKIACVGEKMYGSIPKEAMNYCLIHIGTSTGAAQIFNGVLYQGKSGFSGELTNFSEEQFPDGHYIEKNWIYGLWNISEYIDKHDPSISIKIEKFGIDFEKAEKLYEENNPIFLEALEECAKQNALQFIAYNDFLDFEYFIIEGSILKFKDKYKEYLLKYLSAFNRKEFRAKIIFSNLDGLASLKGAIAQATKLYFLNRLEEIANERSGRGTYDISESFGDDLFE